MRPNLLIATTMLAIGTAVVGQTRSAPEEDLVKVRQRLSAGYAEAIANKDAAAMADHYTVDAVYTQLCPETPSSVGREAITARSAGALKAGLRDYTSTVKTVRLIAENVATSTGTSTFTVNGADGAPQHLKGYWVDTLRREGGQWRVSFQAFTRVPCVQ